MPKEKEVTNHPCHLLSLPSAKRFWCRHCMTVFEDAITRWRHSRLCRYGAVNNFMRRRELEAKALQNTTVLNPVEARLEQSIQMCDLASSSVQVKKEQSPILSDAESFNCFICHKKFTSMEEMRLHVKYPCSSSKIIKSHVPHPKHSVPVYIDALPERIHHWQPPLQHEVQQAAAFVQAHTPHQNSVEMSYDIEIQSQQEMEPQYDSTSVSFDHRENSTSDGITPTNIYVNEQGETVIEVENLDLNSEGGELSLAHLLTQLSQQGIVFDKTRSAELQTAHEVTVTGTSANMVYTTNKNYQNSPFTSEIVEEEEQPTAEDAANTLAQLAGLRSFPRTNEIKPLGGTPVHSQTKPIQNYCYNSSSPGPNKNYNALHVNAHVDNKYGYSASHTVKTQQSIVPAPPGYVNVDHEGVEDAIQFYTDSSSVTYINDQDNNQQTQLETETISSSEYSKHDDDGSDGNHSVLIHSYPAQMDESVQVINTPTEVSAKQICDSQDGELSDNLKVVYGETHVPMTHENGGLSSFETNVSPHCPQRKDMAFKSHENGSKCGVRDLQKNTEVDDFTIQTVSLQEIVDSETEKLTFVGQTDNRNQNENFMSDVPSIHPASSMPASLTDPSSSERQEAQNSHCSYATSDSGNQISYPTALYIVTSSGIIPVPNKKV